MLRFSKNVNLQPEYSRSATKSSRKKYETKMLKCFQDHLDGIHCDSFSAARHRRPTGRAKSILEPLFGNH